MAKIDVSVIIPAYNEEKFLPACLDSLKDQNFDGKYEIIVIDNNSSDRTFEVAQSFGVIAVKETNKGVCFARQKGVSVAQGEYIISTDADCVFPADWIQKHYQALVTNKAVASFGPFVFGERPKWGRLFSRLLFDLVKRFYQRLNKIIYVGASNFAYRKDVWEKVGGYNTSLAQGGDEYDLLKRLKQHGNVVFLSDNRVQTSSRRLKKGMLYSFVITFLGYYILDYLAATYLTGKSVFGHYPAIRDHIEHSWVNTVKSIARNTIIVTVSMILLFAFIPGFRAEPVRAAVRAKRSFHKIGMNARSAMIHINAYYDKDEVK